MTAAPDDLHFVVSQIPTEATTRTLYYRQVWIPDDCPPDPFYVEPNSGRWGTEWTLHTATEPETAWAEYCRNHASTVDRADPTGGVGLNAANLPLLLAAELDLVPARALFGVTFAFAALADLTSSVARAALDGIGFDERDFFADDYSRCPDLAQAGAEAGWEAIQAPSAALRPATCVAVLPGGRQRHVRTTELVGRARPTVHVAVLTTYKGGQRPHWM